MLNRVTLFDVKELIMLKYYRTYSQKFLRKKFLKLLKIFEASNREGMLAKKERFLLPKAYRWKWPEIGLTGMCGRQVTAYPRVASQR